MTRGRTYDVAFVGAGIVGLSAALALLRRKPSLHVVILEKEVQVALHQTGHNSGVMHSGVYYKPRSLKARLCAEGSRRMIAFCDEHGIRYERCGKVIVATEQRELAPLAEIYNRGAANGVVGLTQLGPEGLKEVEPNAAGIAALYLPNVSIVDYGEVARAMAADLEKLGAHMIMGAQALAIHRDGLGYQIETPVGQIPANFLVNCAGLYSDKIAQMAGVRAEVQIVPFRGEYYCLRPERRELVRGLIYPVPDPQMPFLGVHFTKTVHGQLEAGPNAVLAFAREGYTRSRINPGELADTLKFSGFWRMARKFWRTGLYEYYRSFSRREFVRALQKLVPSVQQSDLIPGGAGVRAQAIDRSGNLVDDFRIQEAPAAIHVLNAPSPAATASLAIGDHVASLVAQALL